MNKIAIDRSEPARTAKNRASRSGGWLALACMWMTFPLLASPITIETIHQTSAPPGGEVTLTGRGFTVPHSQYVFLVASSSPPATVPLELDSIVGTDPSAPQTVNLIVGDSLNSVQGNLVVLEGDEIVANPVVLQNDDRLFAVGGSQFSARSCQRAGGFLVEGPQSNRDAGRIGPFGSSLSLSSGAPPSQKQDGPATNEPFDSIWAQPMGNRLEFYLRPSPYESIYATLNHMIDPEDCGDQDFDVGVPGELLMTYLEGRLNSPLELAEDLAAVLQHAFQDREGVSVHSAGPWVTVDLGREVRGDSILLQLFRSD